MTKKISNWYFSLRALPFWGILVFDCLFVVFAGILAFALGHGAEAVSLEFIPLLRTLLIYVVCFLIGFRIFRTYVGVIRFSSFDDLMRLSLAVIMAMILVYVAQTALESTGIVVHFCVRDLLFMGLFAIVFLLLTRVWVHAIYNDYINRSHSRRALVLGIREGGQSIVKNLSLSEKSPYKVLAFTAPENEIGEDERLMGLKVYPFNKHIIPLMRKMSVTDIIVSPLMMDVLNSNAELAEEIIDAGIKLMVLPQATEWTGQNNLSVRHLRPVNVEDLLPRDKIEVDMDAAARLLKSYPVMITGAAGSIGSEMVRQIAPYSPSNLILIDQAETPMHDVRLMMKKQWPDIECETIVADITDAAEMERIFARYRPAYVFHAAAYKHVPMMEDNPYQSVMNNIYGTKVIADLSVKYGTRKFVMVSTDKAVNPTNVMGCSKRICEIYVQSLDKAIKDGLVEGKTQFVTTRFGNVLGSNGSVIPLFEEQIRNGGPVTVTHPDIIRFFMLIPEACKLVVEAGTMGKGGEIYVFDMGEPVKIADLAKRMIRLSGATDVEIVYTGLRDGEKLYEEVLNDSEITLPTFHPKIKIAKVREYNYADVNKDIADLVTLCSTGDDMQIVAGMKRIVPEYKSAHSKYVTLDDNSDVNASEGKK